MLVRSPRLDGPSLGPVAVKWMEHNLVYGPGDLQGKPFRVDPFVAEFLDDLYRLDESGRRLVRRGLLGVGKGNSKSEVAAAIGHFEMLGPCLVDPSSGKAMLRSDPDVPIAAGSFEQADLVFGAARVMCEKFAGDHLDVYDKEILRKDGAGRMYRVAAVAGTNDGLRPSCFIADEGHEWVGNKARVHLVIGNGLSKRDQSVEVNITTAGADRQTPAYRLYEYGLKVASGEVVDPSFLVHWYEADADLDPDDEAELRRIVLQANPASWLQADPVRVMRRFQVDRIPAYEFLRYHGNRWVAAGQEWLPFGVWDRRRVDRGLPDDGAEVVLSFDGSYNRDASALYGWTIEPEPHGFLVGVWERPDGASADWVVPRHEIHKAVADAMGRWTVRELVCDRAYWYDEYAAWAELYGEPPLIEFSAPDGKSRRQAFIAACSMFYDRVVNEQVSHDGHPAVARHLGNAVVKETPDGAYIVKDGRNSPRKIDVAVAAIQGLARAVWYAEPSQVDPLSQIF